MKYSEDLDLILHKELDSVIKMKKEMKGPFDKNIVDKYFKMYLNSMEK